MLLVNKLLKATLLSSLVLSSIYANEESKNFFIGADFSIANDVAKNGCNKSEDKTLFGRFKFGYNLTSPFRIYTSYTPIKWDYAKANLIDVSIDYIKSLNHKFGIFLGASLGYTNLKGDFSGKDSQVNYGVQTGIIYKLNDKVNLEVSYKYINSNDIKAINNQNFLSLDDFNIANFGISYKF